MNMINRESLFILVALHYRINYRMFLKYRAYTGHSYNQWKFSIIWTVASMNMIIRVSLFILGALHYRVSYRMLLKYRAYSGHYCNQLKSVLFER